MKGAKILKALLISLQAEVYEGNNIMLCYLFREIHDKLERFNTLNNTQGTSLCTESLSLISLAYGLFLTPEGAHNFRKPGLEGNTDAP